MSETKTATKAAPKAVKKPRLITIYIPMLPEEDGISEVDQRVTVTLNGENRILLRGEPIEVTPEEYEILYNSQRFERL